jgi:hypothetical protein
MVLFNYIPIDYLWGGKMKTEEQLLIFEMISLTLISLCLILVMIKSKKKFFPELKKLAGIGMWIFFILFLLNTVGNLFAQTTLEKFFALATGLLALLFLRLAMENNTNS